MWLFRFRFGVNLCKLPVARDRERDTEMERERKRKRTTQRSATAAKVELWMFFTVCHFFFWGWPFDLGQTHHRFGIKQLFSYVYILCCPIFTVTFVANNIFNFDDTLLNCFFVESVRIKSHLSFAFVCFCGYWLYLYAFRFNWKWDKNACQQFEFKQKIRNVVRLELTPFDFFRFVSFRSGWSHKSRSSVGWWS